MATVSCPPIEANKNLWRRIRKWMTSSISCFKWQVTLSLQLAAFNFTELKSLLWNLSVEFWQYHMQHMIWSIWYGMIWIWFISSVVLETRFLIRNTYLFRIRYFTVATVCNVSTKIPHLAKQCRWTACIHIGTLTKFKIQIIINRTWKIISKQRPVSKKITHHQGQPTLVFAVPMCAESGQLNFQNEIYVTYVPTVRILPFSESSEIFLHASVFCFKLSIFVSYFWSWSFAIWISSIISALNGG